MAYSTERLSQIDSSLSRYFASYMAPTVVKEHKELVRKQTQEVLDAAKVQQAMPNFGAASSSFTSLSNAEKVTNKTGKWSSKNTDDLYKTIHAKWGKDKKIQHDLAQLCDAFYYELCIAKNGGRDSQDLKDYANFYISNRLQQLTVTQLARQKVPKNSAVYIAKKAWNDSLPGMIVNSGAYSGKRNGDLDQAVNSRAEELYKPNWIEQTAAVGTSMVIDGLSTGGFGGGSSIIVSTVNGAGKAAAKMGAKGFVMGAKATKFFKSWEFGAGSDAAWRVAAGVKESADNVSDEFIKPFSKEMIGDENFAFDIQQGAQKYQRNSTEFQHQLNSILQNKIKPPRPRLDDKVRNTSNNILAKQRGDSVKLLNSIKGTLNSHKIHFKMKEYPPAWMQKLGAKQCRAMAASFYGFAMEMARKNQKWVNIHGKRWTIEECAQRAVDYSKAAVMNDEFKRQLVTASKKKRRSYQTQSQEHQTTTSSSSSTASYNNTVANQQTQQPSGTQQKQDELGGWGDTFDSIGINDFASTSKNLGYVLAMLPDMLIGMFTGKNPDMKLSDNYLPLASVCAGVFVKNPLLRLMLMGYGGLNILNSAGHAALKQKDSSNQKAKVYKTYDDEPLNPRLSQPVMKGRAMLVSIDGTAQKIDISDDAVEAYEQGKVPLNTLANAVLKKFDEQRQSAAQLYEHGMSKTKANEQENVRQIK